jgi:hypothetical protein
MTPLLGNEKGSGALVGKGAQRKKRLGRWQQGDEEGRKTKEHGDGGGAESPNYRRGKRKANRRLDPHDRHNDRVRRVTSPQEELVRRARVRPWGTRLAVKGSKAPRR